MEISSRKDRRPPRVAPAPKSPEFPSVILLPSNRNDSFTHLLLLLGLCMATGTPERPVYSLSNFAEIAARIEAMLSYMTCLSLGNSRKKPFYDNPDPNRSKSSDRSTVHGDATALVTNHSALTSSPILSLFFPSVIIWPAQHSPTSFSRFFHPFARIGRQLPQILPPESQPPKGEPHEERLERSRAAGPGA